MIRRATTAAIGLAFAACSSSPHIDAPEATLESDASAKDTVRVSGYPPAFETPPPRSRPYYFVEAATYETLAEAEDAARDCRERFRRDMVIFFVAELGRYAVQTELYETYDAAEAERRRLADATEYSDATVFIYERVEE
jgi:hypothetical protein